MSASGQLCSRFGFCLAVAVLLVLCACEKPTPLTVTCTPGRHQSAGCEIRSGPETRVHYLRGNIPSGEFGTDSAGALHLDVSWEDLPFDVREVRFVAKARGLREADVEWMIPPVRYHATMTVDEATIGTVRFEVAPGAIVSWNGAALEPGGSVKIDLRRDLPFDKLMGDSRRELPFSIRTQDGTTLDDSFEADLPAAVSNDLVDQIRQRGVALPFAAAFAAGAHPAMLVTEDRTITALNGLTKLGETQVMVFASDDGATDVEFCGVYQVKSLATPVSRVRMSRDVEAFEARTGKLISKTTLRGSSPRGCREYETVQKGEGGLYPAMIKGTRIDEAAIAAWVSAL